MQRQLNNVETNMLKSQKSINVLRLWTSAYGNFINFIIRTSDRRLRRNS